MTNVNIFDIVEVLHDHEVLPVETVEILNQALISLLNVAADDSAHKTEVDTPRDTLADAQCYENGEFHHWDSGESYDLKNMTSPILIRPGQLIQLLKSSVEAIKRKTQVDTTQVDPIADAQLSVNDLIRFDWHVYDVTEDVRDTYKYHTGNDWEEINEYNLRRKGHEIYECSGFFYWV